MFFTVMYLNYSYYTILFTKGKQIGALADVQVHL